MNNADKFKSTVTFRHVVQQFSALDEDGDSLSDVYYARGLSWRIRIYPYGVGGEKVLWLFLDCVARGINLHTLACRVHAVLRLVSQKQGVADIEQEIDHRFTAIKTTYSDFEEMSWNDICVADKGYIKDDVVIFEVTIGEVVLDAGELKQGRFQKEIQDLMRPTVGMERYGCYSFRHYFPFVIEPAGTKTLSDVVLVCQDKHFYCHRNVLSEGSAYFRAMFTGGFADANLTKIVLEDKNISSDTMQEILRFIYCRYIATDLAQATPEVQYEFLYAAKTYLLDSLVDLICLALEECLSPDNACRYLLMADSFGLEPLKFLCFNVMANNGDTVRDSPEFEEVVGTKELVKELSRFLLFKLSMN